MKKVVWITFGVSLVLVNLIAEAVYYFSGQEIIMFFRVTLIFGIVLIAIIFSGVLALIGVLDEERPLSGHANDSLGVDPSEIPKPPQETGE